MDLSVVIVGYQSAAFLPRCLDALSAGTHRVAFEAIVVDNGSTDGTRALLERDYPGVLLLANEDNRGFARAVNQGAARALGRNILLLNPDTEIEDGALDESLAYLDAHPEVGIVGARVNNPDGSLQRACRRSIPTPMVSFFRLSGLGRLFHRHPAARAYNLDDADPDVTMEVEAVSGSFLLVRREAFDATGGMDERYFLYGEDLDFCWAVRRAGWRVVYHPRAVVLHHKGASSRQASRRANREYHRSMVHFYRKHFAAGSAAWLNAAILGAISVRGFVTDWALRLGWVRHVGSRG